VRSEGGAAPLTDKHNFYSRLGTP